jgi:NodT family efflux transporter outer membrane factor (OMF) lipoprotein
MTFAPLRFRLADPTPGRRRQVGREALVALAAGLSLASCEVGPDYSPPVIAFAPFHNAEAVEARAAREPPPPLDRWWTGFKDPELTRVIERVFAENLNLQASMARANQARAAAKAAGAKLGPTMDATAQGTFERLSLENPIAELGRASPGFERDGALYDVGGAAAWEVDLFGGLRRGEEAAQAEAEAAEAAQLGTRVMVAAEAADAYLQIRGDQARLQVAERQVATERQLRDLVTLRRARGMGADREVAQAEALLAQAEGAVPLLRAALDAQMNRLDVLMGAQPGADAAELNDAAALPAIPRILASAADLRRRPDVIAAERRLAAANARIGAAIAEYYPKLSLNGVLGNEAVETSHLITPSTFQPLGGVGLRWRLFDFGRIDAEVEGADAASREALLNYRSVVLRAAEEVENACMNLVQLEAHARAAAAQIKALTRARDDSEEAYKGGLIALTDVLDADRQLLAAEDDLPRTQTDAGRAAVSLFRASGGGW